MKTAIGDILKSATAEPLKRILQEANNIVITCHFTPDGDAVGSTLALGHLLRGLGKRAVVVTPDMPPKNLMWLPGAKEIRVFSRYEQLVVREFAEADLICCLDFNAPKRVDRLEPLLLSSPAKKVLIDHHLDPENFVDFAVSQPWKSSTCSLLYELIVDMGWKRRINQRVAECLYTGMMTDTGNFSYNSLDPALYEAIAYFVELGVDKDSIYNRVCNSNSVGFLRLNGYALAEKMEVFPDHRCALITLTQEELNRFGYERGDTEGLVNKPLSVPELVYSVFLREESDYVKVSTRSRGDFPVNKLCEAHFNGGGHLNAAGGEFYGTMEEAIELFKSVMPQYDQYLPKENEND